MAGAEVIIRGLTRRFEAAGRASVDDVTLTLSPGETLCLIGPSGCGKSTTLRLIAGLERPDAGQVLIDGRDMQSVPPQARDVAMVFQGFALYPHLTVRDNLAFPLRMRKVARVERERSVAETADRLGISRLLDRYPAELSGGERQRVAMGRAIVRRPKVFLFDEPLSNLDAALRGELRVELARLLKSLDATALYVTHDQVEAMTLGDRVAVLREGSLEQVDAPRRIYESPATAFVARFFGAPPMNLFAGTRAGATVRIGPLELANPPQGGGDAFMVGVRPEHVHVDGKDADAIAFDARVSSVEPLGAETHVELEADGLLLRARVPGFESKEVGSRVRAAIDGRFVHWFDAATGKRREA